MRVCVCACMRVRVRVCIYIIEAMFWQRCSAGKSEWHNGMGFTEECDVLSSLPLSHSAQSLSFGLSMPFFIISPLLSQQSIFLFSSLPLPCPGFITKQGILTRSLRHKTG